MHFGVLWWTAVCFGQASSVNRLFILRTFNYKKRREWSYSYTYMWWRLATLYNGHRGFVLNPLNNTYNNNNNNNNNNRRSFYIKDHLVSRKKQVPFSMAIEMGNPCTSVFPNTRALEQQEWNKIKKQTKTERRETLVWEDVKRARKRSPDGLSQANPNSIIINIWYCLIINIWYCLIIYTSW